MTLPLEVSDLTVSSPGGRVLLRVPPLSVPAGQMVGVRGPSGAGKSTLIYALAGLLTRARGRAVWGETDVLALSAEGRARFRAEALGIVFQDFMLFDELSAVANAGVSALFRPKAERAAITERAGQHLARLGVISERRKVASYSGGERQRIAVARALAARPAALLTDEPTASLDRVAADRLVDDLIAMVREMGATFVTVSHDEALLARMDRVLTVQDGAIAGDTQRAAA